jgi:hypothetical protein
MYKGIIGLGKILWALPQGLMGDETHAERIRHIDLPIGPSERVGWTYMRTPRGACP